MASEYDLGRIEALLGQVVLRLDRLEASIQAGRDNRERLEGRVARMEERWLVMRWVASILGAGLASALAVIIGQLLGHL